LALRDFIGVSLEDTPPDHSTVIEEVVADKGYHSRTTIHDLDDAENC
jgi:hypothetical protein